MKKFLPYILILIILAGLFSVAKDAQAQVCWRLGATRVLSTQTQAFCESTAVQGTWQAPGTPVPPPPNGPPLTGPAPTPGTVVTDPCASVGGGQPGNADYDACKTEQARIAAIRTVAPSSPTNQTEFDKVISANSCGLGLLDHSSVWPGCFIQISYGLFYVIPSFLLWVAAYFFNVLISITLNSNLLAGSEFISNAWGVVRDLSNIFFILILLYIAVKIILDLGGSEAKKMIAKVIIVALLINFSMFFTQVVIDSSNILALIFYNKLDVCINKNVTTGKCRDYPAAGTEKDVAGSIVGAFNPTSLLSPTFFSNAGIQQVPGGYAPIEGNTPAGVIIGITIVTGLLMFFAVYCFFIAGFSFVGRLIELWVLIIFSPFAFMSSTVPKLNEVEYIGWGAWFKRLIKTAFMAPIFMFFLYFIFLLIQKGNPFAGVVTDNKGKINTILLVIIPALVILILLLKATEFAKKGSGKFGEVLTKAAGTVGGMATGLALGAATGGAAMALRGTIGRGAANIAESNKFRDWAANTRGGQFISNRISGIAGRSFDAREAPGAGALAKMGGVNLGAAKAVGLGPKKGFAQNRVEAVKAREEFVTKQLDTGNKGIQEMTRGGMNDNQATKAINQMTRGGMNMFVAEDHRKALMGGGMALKDAKTAALHMNEARRHDLADRLKTSMFASKRVVANRIRKGAGELKEDADMKNIFEKIALRLKEETPQKEEGGKPAAPHAPAAAPVSAPHAPVSAPHAPTSAPHTPDPTAHAPTPFGLDGGGGHGGEEHH